VEKALFLYSSHDGQTIKIMKYIEKIYGEEFECDWINLATYPKVDFSLYNKVVVGAAIRYGFLHKSLYRFIEQYQRELGKHILDANFGERVRQLEYKATWYGRTISKIDHWFPSSKKCACCGAMYPGKWSLAIREWTCPSCFSVNDRDVNASCNIHIEGLRLLTT